MLLRDDIYTTLRQNILSLKLAPGSELREQLLAEEFSVSKSPVREALLRLEQERLVEIMSRQGYRVAPISISDAQDMYSFRIVLEAACAIEAARRATKEQLAALDDFRTHSKVGGNSAFINRNREFHCLLFEMTGNMRMSTVARDLIEQMDRMTRISIRAMPDHDPSHLVQEHSEIIDALQKRDGRKAAKLLRDHVLAASKRVLKALNHAAVTT